MNTEETFEALKKKFGDRLEYYPFVSMHRIEVNLTKRISWDEFKKGVEEMGGTDWSEHIPNTWTINGTKIVAFKGDRASR